MQNKFIAIGAISLMASAASASSLAGHFSWVQGTLASQITITTSYQTISLKVGTVTDTFTDTFIPGIVGNVLPVGTPMVFLEKGSAPFQGTYSGSHNVQVFDPSDGLSTSTRRTIGIDSTGALSYSVAIQNYSYGSSMSFYLPAVTVGTTNFVNGVSFQISSPIASYSLLLPTGTATTFSNVNFPVGSVPLNNVSFNAAGNGTLNFTGSGVGTTVDVAGNLTGSGTTLTAATFFISSDN